MRLHLRSDKHCVLENNIQTQTHENLAKEKCEKRIHQLTTNTNIIFEYNSVID